MLSGLRFDPRRLKPAAPEAVSAEDLAPIELEHPKKGKAIADSRSVAEFEARGFRRVGGSTKRKG